MKPFFRVEHVYGRSEADASLYLTRYIAGPLRFHVFWRGDRDPAPHDHPWNFWTFPLRGYHEEVTLFYGDSALSYTYNNYVKPFRLHFRPSSHKHRVLPRQDGKPIYTLVITGKRFRDWGFYPTYAWAGMKRARMFVPWRKYIHGQGGPGE